MIPKKVLDLFPMWEYQCPICQTYVEPNIVFCPKCKASFDQMKWRVPPRFLKSRKAMSDYAHKILALKLQPNQRALLFKYFTDLFTDDFENGNLNKWDATGGTIEASQDYAHGGSWSCKSNPPGYGNGYASKTLSAQQTCYMRQYVRFEVAPSSGVAHFMALWISGSYLCVQGQFMKITGKQRFGIKYRDADAYSEAWDSTIEIALSTWYCVEIYAYVHQTAGEAKIFVDGTELTACSKTGLDNADSQTGINYAYTGAFSNLTGTAILQYIDDVIVADTYIGPEGAVETYTKDFTVDALLKATQKITFNADALLKAIQTKAFSADAFLKFVQTMDFTVDGLLLKRQTKDFTTDAILLKAQTKDFSLDALLTKAMTKDFTVDALLKLIQTKDFSTDGILLKAQTIDFLADAILTLIGKKDFSTDAILKAVLTKDFSVDAILTGASKKDFTVDAILRLLQTVNFTVDAILTQVSTIDFTIDALLLKEQTIDFTADAILTTGITEYTKDFLVDAILKKVLTKTFKVDALLLKPQVKTFSLDALLLKAQIKVFLVDAFLTLVYTKTFTMDALLLKEQKKTFTVDAIIAGEVIPPVEDRPQQPSPSVSVSVST